MLSRNKQVNIRPGEGGLVGIKIFTYADTSAVSGQWSRLKPREIYFFLGGGGGKCKVPILQSFIF